MNYPIPWATPSPEDTKTPSDWCVITREAVIAAYRQLIEHGIKNPFDLELESSEVKAAQKMFDSWRSQEAKRMQWDVEGEGRVNLSTTMLYVEAGFTHPEYLKDVLSQLTQDASRTPKVKDNEARTHTRILIAQARQNVLKLLVPSLGNT